MAIPHEKNGIAISILIYVPSWTALLEERGILTADTMSVNCAAMARETMTNCKAEFIAEVLRSCFLEVIDKVDKYS